MQFLSDFGSKKPLSQECRHRFRIGRANTKWLSDTFLQIAFGMLFGSEKPTKNHPKTRSEPLKNRCQKRCFFQHRFFRVSASILEALGAPRWSQVGSFRPQKVRTVAFLNCLKLDVFKNGVLEASGLDFGGPGPRFWRLRASILEAPGLDFRASRPTCSGKTLFPQVSCLKRLPLSLL